MYHTLPHRWPLSIPVVYVRPNLQNRSLVVLYRTVRPHKQRTNLTSVTRMCLSLAAYNSPPVVIDSDTTVGVFDWASRGSEGYVYLALGMWDPPSTFDTVSQFADLIIFDPAWPKGLCWGRMRLLWPKNN